MSRVTTGFLHRSLFNQQQFPEVGRILREQYGFDILHVLPIGNIEGEEVFQFDQRIEEIWDDIDISYFNLRRLEKKYSSTNLMRALYSEREYNFFPKYYGLRPVPYEKQLKYLVACISVFEECIERYNIDCFISALPTGLPDVLHTICTKKGIQYISLRSSKLLPGFVLCDQHHDLPAGMMEAYKSFLQTGIPDKYYELAKLHLNELRRKINMPSYMAITGEPFKMLTMRRIGVIFSMLFSNKYHIKINKISREKHQTRNSILWNMHRLTNVLRTRMNRPRWFCSDLPPGEEYFVFPLQYEPEASTFVRAFPFFDQMGIIQQISTALPLGTTLVVKEHKGNHGYRKASFYKELHYLPNVKLVGRETELNNLISNSIGIITLTSRMGWEGLVYRKPVIAFGTSFYTFNKRVHKPSSWMELKKIIEDCVANKDKDNDRNGSDDDEDLLAYTAAYISLTHEGNYVPGTEGALSESNNKKIAKALFLEIKNADK